MASKRRSRSSLDITPLRTNYSTRRAKSIRQAKKHEDTKLISERTSKRKNVISEIEKPKSRTDKKPREADNSDLGKQLKQRKIHKWYGIPTCSIAFD